MSQEITAEELKQLLNSDWNGQLIDVRQPEEFAEARIEGSQLVPLAELTLTAEKWNKDANYIVHCKSGMRSAKGISQLKDIGFTDLTNLAGGIEAWKEAGFDHPAGL